VAAVVVAAAAAVVDVAAAVAGLYQAGHCDGNNDDGDASDGGDAVVARPRHLQLSTRQAQGLL
jgi:hypothetical protein